MKSKKILIVDDQSEVLEFLSEELEMEGHDVIKANCGADAFKALQSIKDIDLMISDVEMPNMNGLALLDKVNQEIPHHPPVFFMTGVCPEKRDVLLEKGAVEVLLKPFTYQQLIKAIMKHLENK